MAVPAPLPCAVGICAMPVGVTVMVALAGGGEVALSAGTVAVLGRTNTQPGSVPTTKSERVALRLCEERVSATKLAKQELRPRAVRLTPSSRNSPVKKSWLPVLLLLVKGQGISPFVLVMGWVLTSAASLP